MAIKYNMDWVFWGSIRTVARGDTGLQIRWRKQWCHVFYLIFQCKKSNFVFYLKNVVIYSLIFAKSHLYQSLYLSAQLHIFFLILNKEFHNFINLSSLRQKHVQLHPRSVQKSHKFKMSTTNEIVNENK